MFHSRNFSVVVLNKKRKSYTKFAFIVSSKISPQASRRNRIRRVLSETVRHNISYVKSGYSVLFLAKKSIANKNTDEIMLEVKNALRGTRLLK